MNAPPIHFSRERKQTTPFLRLIYMGITGSTISGLGNLPRGGEIRTGEHPYNEAKRQPITR